MSFPTGPFGNVWRAGVGVPQGVMGNEGDTYTDTSTNLVYGPKSKGTWGTPRSLGGGSVAVAPATGVQATDAAAINAAIAAAGPNGSVYFPAGTYVADMLAPLSGQSWTGPGTIMRPTGSLNSVITATGLTGFSLSRLTIDGNRANSSATSNAAVYLINSTWTRINNATVQNTPANNAGIILRGSVQGIVSDCRLTTVGYGVLLGLNHGDNYPCYGNLIRGVTIDGTDMDAIFLTENLGSTTSIPVVGSVIGTVVSGCTVRNFGDSGVEVGSGTVYTEVSGCTFNGIANGAGNNGILFRDALHASVTGCTVSNLTKPSGSNGVYMFNLNGTNAYIDVTDVNVYNVGYGYLVNGTGGAATSINITGGSIDTTALDGIQLNNVNGFSITGTQVHNAGQQGISIGKFNVAGSSNGTITGTRVYNSGQQTTGQSGLIMFQNTSNVTVSNSHFSDIQGTPTQGYGVRIFDSTVTNVTVRDCTLNGNVTLPLTSAASASNGIKAFDNTGFNPQGMQTVTLSGTSPTSYQAGITEEVLYLNGGSSVSLTKNGLALPYNSASGSAYLLKPGETINISWTGSAPNFSRSDRK